MVQFNTQKVINHTLKTKHLKKPNPQNKLTVSCLRGIHEINNIVLINHCGCLYNGNDIVFFNGMPFCFL